MLTLYACIPGWGVAVLRAWVATVLVLLILPLGHRVALPRMFLFVAAIMLTCDPLAPLPAGFWLSFGAVAVSRAGTARRTEIGDTPLAIPQIVPSTGTVPALLATIGNVAWVGPLTNLFAVPIVSLIVVPLDLVAGVIIASGERRHLGSQSVDAVIRLVVAYLRVLAQFDWTS